MTVKEMRNYLNNLPEEFEDKEIKVMAKNGLMMSPEIKYKLVNTYDVFDRSPENVEYIVLSYE